ncbi:MAG: hypothetical protein ACLR5S_03940 [Ruminococcus sp.]
MKPFQETNYIAKDKENEQWKSSLPPEEVKERCWHNVDLLKKTAARFNSTTPYLFSMQ